MPQKETCAAALEKRIRKIKPSGAVAQAKGAAHEDQGPAHLQELPGGRGWMRRGLATGFLMFMHVPWSPAKARMAGEVPSPRSDPRLSL